MSKTISIDRVRGFAIVRISSEITRCVLCATDWVPGAKERHADLCPAIAERATVAGERYPMQRSGSACPGCGRGPDSIERCDRCLKGIPRTSASTPELFASVQEAARAAVERAEDAEGQLRSLLNKRTARTLDVPPDFRCTDCGQRITNHVVVSRCETKGCEESYTGPPFEAEPCASEPKPEGERHGESGSEASAEVGDETGRSAGSGQRAHPREAMGRPGGLRTGGGGTASEGESAEGDPGSARTGVGALPCASYVVGVDHAYQGADRTVEHESADKASVEPEECAVLDCREARMVATGMVSGRYCWRHERSRPEAEPEAPSPQTRGFRLALAAVEGELTRLHRDPLPGPIGAAADRAWNAALSQVRIFVEKAIAPHDRRSRESAQPTTKGGSACLDQATKMTAKAPSQTTATSETSPEESPTRTLASDGRVAVSEAEASLKASEAATLLPSIKDTDERSSAFLKRFQATQGDLSALTDLLRNERLLGIRDGVKLGEAERMSLVERGRPDASRAPDCTCSDPQIRTGFVSDHSHACAWVRWAASEKCPHGHPRGACPHNTWPACEPRRESPQPKGRELVDCTECPSVGLGAHKRCAEDAVRTCPAYAEYKDARNACAAYPPPGYQDCSHGPTCPCPTCVRVTEQRKWSREDGCACSCTECAAKRHCGRDGWCALASDSSGSARGGSDG